MPLPTSRAFITSLFNALSRYESPLTENNQASPISALNPTLPANPLLKSVSQIESLKPLLTTLHLLFPNELLPALDLIDRNLVSKLILQTSTTKANQADNPHHENAPQSIYIVRSSSTPSRTQQFSPRRSADAESRYQGNVRGVSYEVRLQAWNCTCPAFAFDAVSSMGVGVEVREEERGDQRGEVRGGSAAEWEYGGLRVGSAVEGGEGMVPICKHLLACLFVERCPLLREGVALKRISENEMAGWNAGWAD